MEKLVSIIIPCYNINIDYFNRCLESIKTQSIGFENLDVLLIDDSSTINSQHIVEYSNKYDNVKYFRTSSNLGPGIARNIGLNNTHTKYVMFLDYDDFYIDDKVIEDAYNSIKDSNYEVVFGEFLYQNRLVKYSDNDKKGLLKYSPSIFSKIFDLDFLNKNNIRFTHFKNSQDAIFMLDVIYSLTNYKLIDRVFIYYEIHETSISNNFSEESLLTRLRAKVYFDSLAKSYGLSYEDLDHIMFSMNWLTCKIFPNVVINSSSKYLNDILVEIDKICNLECLDYDVVESLLNISKN